MLKKTSKADLHFDTLFGARQGEQIARGFKLIPREKITRGQQPRQSFPESEINELSDSILQLRERGEGIEQTGILQPLLVTESDEGYRLIAGERRYRASEKAGVEQLPVIVVEMDEGGVLLAQLVENLQRRDLPPIEEAQGIDLLMREQKLSLREAARVLGKGKGYLENRLNLLKMGEDVQKMVSVRTDTLLQAREINAVSNSKERVQLIRAVLDEGISHAEVRRRIEKHTAASGRAGQSPQLSVHTDSQDAGDENSDPLLTALRPAVAFAAEFGRQISSISITQDYRQAITQELELLKREIVSIEKSMKG